MPLVWVESHTPLEFCGVRIIWKIGEDSKKQNKNDQRVEKLQKYLVWRREG